MLNKFLFALVLSLISSVGFAQNGTFQVPASTSSTSNAAWQQMQQNLKQAQQAILQNNINAQQYRQQQINAIVQPLTPPNLTGTNTAPAIVAPQPIAAPTVDSTIQTPPPSPPPTATGLPQNGNSNSSSGNWNYGF